MNFFKNFFLLTFFSFLLSEKIFCLFDSLKKRFSNMKDSASNLVSKKTDDKTKVDLSSKEKEKKNAEEKAKKEALVKNTKEKKVTDESKQKGKKYTDPFAGMGDVFESKGKNKTKKEDTPTLLAKDKGKSAKKDEKKEPSRLSKVGSFFSKIGSKVSESAVGKAVGGIASVTAEKAAGALTEKAITNVNTLADDVVNKITGDSSKKDADEVANMEKDGIIGYINPTKEETVEIANYEKDGRIGAIVPPEKQPIEEKKQQPTPIVPSAQPVHRSGSKRKPHKKMKKRR